MEPVEPRMAIFFTGLFSQTLRALFSELRLEASECEELADDEDEPQDGGGQEQGVDAVEDAAVAGEQGAGVLDAGPALEGGLEEVAELGGGVEQDGEEHPLPPGSVGVQAGEAGVVRCEPVAVEDEAAADDDGGDDGGDGSFPGLVGRELGGELVAAEALADVEGGDVAGPYAEEEEDDQHQTVTLVAVPDERDERERVGDVDEQKQACGGLGQDAGERRAEGVPGEEQQRGEDDGGDGVLRTKEGREEKEGDREEGPPERNGVAAGGGELAELERREHGDQRSEEGNHPELAEEDEQANQNNEDDCGEDALHAF